MYTSRALSNSHGSEFGIPGAPPGNALLMKHEELGVITSNGSGAQISSTQGPEATPRTPTPREEREPVHFTRKQPSQNTLLPWLLHSYYAWQTQNPQVWGSQSPVSGRSQMARPSEMAGFFLWGSFRTGKAALPAAA